MGVATGDKVLVPQVSSVLGQGDAVDRLRLFLPSPG